MQSRIVKNNLFVSEGTKCLQNGEKKGTNDGELTFEISADKISEGLDKAFNRNKKKY